MGWNSISQRDDEHPLWHKIPNHSHFYFVHSYYCDCSQSQYIGGTTNYGHDFTSAIADKKLLCYPSPPRKKR